MVGRARSIGLRQRGIDHLDMKKIEALLRATLQ
jgi:hypothetical protein